MADKQPIRILIIDDSPEDRATYIRYLGEDEWVSYQVLEADEGEGGFALCLQSNPDCVLLDYHLPDLDGLEVLARIREDSRTEGIPVIMITGTGNEPTAVSAMKGGAFDYLVKETMDGESLRRAIQHALERLQAAKKEEERALLLEMSNRELRQASTRLTKVLDSSIIGVFFWDRDGFIRTASSTFHAMLGYAPGELTERPTRWGDLVPEGRGLRSETALLKLSRLGNMDPFEQTFQRKDGTCVDVLMGLAVLDGPGEERVGFCLDITRRKQFEKALQQSEEQLRKSQKMEAIGKLAGGIAHDFNNLLTAISGYTALAQAELEPGSRLQEYLGEVALSANRAAVLTSRLLAYGRKQFISPKIVDVNEFLETMENALRRVLGEAIRLDFRLEPAVGNTRVDPGQIEQVILNLAENARDAMPGGGTFAIETSNREVDAYSPGLPLDIEPGAYIALTVSDTGTGIAPDAMGHIFEPFFTTKPMRRGGGLGLSMVEGIVKQNGGHIVVRSEPGKGSSFGIFLPKLASVLEPGNGRPVPSPRKTAADRRETVLVVEDEDTVRRLVRLVLQANGYNVLEAGNGVAAERLARETDEPIHLLLTDALMARMGGRELAESLRRSRPGMEVVYMSGYTDDAVVRQGLLESTDHTLRKPFSPQALLQKVREVLAVRASS